MNPPHLNLKPFANRVRLLRAWRGFGLGLLFAGLCGLVWALLDLTAVAFAEWLGLGLLAVFGALSGSILGLLWPLKEKDLASSIDSRAKLEDRLGTAMDGGRAPTPMDDAQRKDTEEKLSGIKAKQVYPMTVSRWHYGALAACTLASGVFLMGNSDFMLNSKDKATKTELKAAAQAVERVAKPIEESAKKEGKQIAAEKKTLAREMMKFAQELKKGRLNKEQTLQKLNDLSAKAQKLSQEQTQQVQEKLAPMQAAAAEAALMKQSEVSKADLESLSMDQKQSEMLQQMMSEAGIQPGDMKTGDDAISKQDLEQMGLDKIDPNLMNLTDEQKKALSESLQKKLDELAAKEAKGELTEAEKQMQELMKELSSKLQMSDKVQKALKEMMSSPEYKQLSKKMQELAQKMKEAQEQMQQTQKPLTKEEVEQLRQAAEEAKEKMEEFAKKWADPYEREKMLEQMKQMLEMLENGELTLEACRTCMGLLPGMPGMGIPAPMPGGVFQDTEQINKLDKPEKGEGTPLPTSVKGQRDPKKGEEWYSEIKAPTTLGTRSSVPYSQVLPSYKKQAEKAINKKKIPKNQEKRVKRYFESLTGAKP